jgi:hypothetical protein
MKPNSASTAGNIVETCSNLADSVVGRLLVFLPHTRSTFSPDD